MLAEIGTIVAIILGAFGSFLGWINYRANLESQKQLHFLGDKMITENIHEI